MEAASVRDYHTFVWSSVPESTTDGSPTHASVQFQGIKKDGRAKEVVVWGEGGGLTAIKSTEDKEYESI